ncbi:retrotransposon protein, putative, ty1-copia subclass [Tanacetum coccineum]
MKLKINSGRPLSAIRSDRGGEYISQEFKDYLKANGIVQQLTPPYTPQHNGVSERRNRTLLDMVRSMMNLTTLPLSFWDYAIESFPNLSYLKVWGCEALVKRDTPDKLEQRSAEFFESVLISQEISGRAVDLEEIQEEEDRQHSYEISRANISQEVEGFEPHKREVTELRVECYCDAGFETDRDDTKSQTGYVFILNGGAVDWKSSKQSTTAMSATESEYIAASEAAMEAVWIRKFISGLAEVALCYEPGVQVKAPTQTLSTDDIIMIGGNVLWSISRILRPFFYDPVRVFWTPILGKLWGQMLGIIVTFVVSGLIHELMYAYVTCVWPTWEVTWFFVLHGLCSAVELAVKKAVNGRFQLPWLVSGPITLSIVLATGFWLFFPQIVRNGVDVQAINEYSILVKAFTSTFE